MILALLVERVCERIENYYDWDLFSYWLGDESALGPLYLEVFETILMPDINLTETQRELIKKKGSNLETMIGKWRQKWRENNTQEPNEEIPWFCLRLKMNEYIFNQINNNDIKSIIGNPC
jgi:hypothetical protein